MRSISIFALISSLRRCQCSVKVRRGGVGSNYCIHRYFYDQSSSWKAIREEENIAESSVKQLAQHEEQEHEEEVDADAPGQEVDVRKLNFTPIDARHLSSLPLVRGRLVKLLKASNDHVHAATNILIRLVRFNCPMM